MFMRVQTQWITGAMGGFIGLNYQSVDFLFRLYDVEDQRGMLEDLQVIEREALKILNERKD